MGRWRAWWAVASSGSVVLRALKTSILVGALLTAINHGDALLAGQIDLGRLVKIALTVLVPYTVSTTSSVAAILESQKKS